MFIEPRDIDGIKNKFKKIFQSEDIPFEADDGDIKVRVKDDVFFIIFDDEFPGIVQVAMKVNAEWRNDDEYANLLILANSINATWKTVKVNLLSGRDRPQSVWVASEFVALTPEYVNKTLCGGLFFQISEAMEYFLERVNETRG